MMKWLYLGLLVEILALTVFQTYLNSNLLPVLFLMAGLMIVTCSFFKSTKPQYARIPPITLWVFVLGLVLFIWYRAPLIFDLIPIDYRIADMLPVMATMTDRWFAQQDIYALIPEFWGGTKPIYLPSLWLPLVLFESLAVDLRWCGVLGLSAVAVLTIFLKSNRPSLVSLLPIFVGLGALFIWHARFQLNLLTMSNEGIVFMYYALLCFAIARDYPILTGIALSLCLLSRYIIAPWAMMFFIVYWFTMDKNAFTRLVSSTIITVVLVLTVGKAWGQIGYFLGLSEHYLSALISNPGKYEPLIAESLSLTRYVAFEKLKLVHQLMTIAAFAIPLLCGLYFYLKRKDIDFRLFALASMKLCLIGFFALLTMPYHYLFYTSFIVSLCLISYVLNKGLRSKDELVIETQ